MNDEEKGRGIVQLPTLASSVVSRWHSEEAFLSWQEQVAAQLEELRREKYALVELISRCRDMAEQENLERQLAFFLRNEALHREQLSEFTGAHRDLCRHFQIFCEGRHKQERAILHLARIEGSSLEKIRGDLWLFGKLLRRVYENSVGAKLKKRDEAYLEGFTAYSNGTHEYQKELAELARIDGVKLDGITEQERYSAFIQLVREHDRLELVRKGLGIRSAEELVREARAATVVEKKKREESETRERKVEEEAGRLRRQVSEKELSKQRENERIARRRKQVREHVRQIRREEELRAKRGGEIQFHPECGVLIAEDWIRLRLEEENGEWGLLDGTEQKSACEPYFFQIIDEMIAPDDFEEKYLAREILEVIRSLNLFFAGQGSYGQVIESARHRGILASRVESWLGVDFRRTQQSAFHAFERKKHRFQKELEALILREFNRPISLDEWIELWDRMPAPFIEKIDRERRKRYNDDT